MTREELRDVLLRFKEANSDSINLTDTTGNDPLSQLEVCEWTIELNIIPLSISSLFEADYGFRLVGSYGDKFPRTRAMVSELLSERRAPLCSNDWIGFGKDGMGDIPYLSYCEMALSLNNSLKDYTVENAREIFPRIKFASHAFPLTASAIGLTNGPRYSPRQNNTQQKYMEPTIVALPQHLADRIPAGHTLRRYTGTMEFVQGNNNTGQRNFYLAPIRGEEHLALELGGGQRFGVTDLPIEQHNGHRVVLFGFIGPTWKTGFFLCYSRSNQSWITLHNQHANIHIFEQPKMKAGGILGTLVAGLISPSLIKVAADANAEKNRHLSAGETHALIIDIRQYLESIMEEPGNNAPPRL